MIKELITWLFPEQKKIMGKFSFIAQGMKGPAPPPNGLYKIGSLEFCLCGSSLKHRMFRPIGCIQPRCPNYAKDKI